jgi:hypothetical protein
LKPSILNEIIKIFADYFSNLATALGSFIIIGTMIALVSPNSTLTIQGNKVDEKLLFSYSFFAIILSLVLLGLSCLFLLFLDENEVG